MPNASIVTISVAANQSDATIFIGNNNLPKDGASWRPAEITIPKRESLPSLPRLLLPCGA